MTHPFPTRRSSDMEVTPANKHVSRTPFQCMGDPPPATLAGRLRKAVAHSADPQTGRLLREQTRRFERLTDRPAVRAMLCTDQHYPESFPDLLPRLGFGRFLPAPAKTASIIDRKSVQFGSFSSGWARSRALRSDARRAGK